MDAERPVVVRTARILWIRTVGERGGNGFEDDEEVRAAHRSEDVSVATELELYGIWGRAR